MKALAFPFNPFVAVDLSGAEVVRNKPAPAGVSGIYKDLPETVAERTLRLRSGLACLE